MADEDKKMERLDDEDLEKAAGGEYGSSCWLGCSGDHFIDKVIDGKCYYAWRCDNCGHEYFVRDGVKISPSEFYSAVYSV